MESDFVIAVVVLLAFVIAWLAIEWRGQVLIARAYRARVEEMKREQAAVRHDLVLLRHQVARARREIALTRVYGEES